MRRYDILTLFPGFFQGPLSESILKRAQQRGIVQIAVHDLRNYAHDRHAIVDDRPYGGGAGMVLKPEPIIEAVTSLRQGQETHLILLTPQGRPFKQAIARELSEYQHLLCVCGRYEGFDERVRDLLSPDEISIGDYVLTGGELPALVLLDAVIRLIPGVLGDEDSARYDSFVDALLEFPHYTRPQNIQGRGVPDVLLSGDHERIRRWRRKEALRRTKVRRPDLLQQAFLSKEDLDLLGEIEDEQGAS
ncbi:tRNA (guanosine(37)-N1)-methyltransferase TrmD [Candidatus Methylomirabilis limnetica]|uniref:tRNA (guanine-N(1)-)-methyltransferase n=1 Tax=Candidatus Methylomirabilis limnetica TaxID=2033718 RepID=A0A2T4TYI8_9BACT|nr:tRNA (guanosine(37)-N1)-methyltransferase TrmD [Candidatus Methylomirabilis limnetica]PTL36170.1 tRNA (guanosine(37)-N1)-methyltransferase TrmD [Candidatus Methylomirabilis limnetica]